MEAVELSELSYSEFATSVADLRGIHRINSLDDDSFIVSFVFDELLESEEAPIMNPIIHFFASILFVDSCQVFHYNFVSTIQPINNVFADVVVYPIHVTVFSSTHLFQEFLAGTSAFLLKFGTQMSELSFNLLNFVAVEEDVFRSDCEIIDSHVYSNCFSSMFETNVFVEAEYEIASSLLVNSQQAFADFPIVEIFLVNYGDVEWYFDSSFDCAYTENVVFDCYGAWEVVSDGTIFDNRFTLCYLDHSTCLFYTCDAELCLESELFQSSIDEWLEFSSIGNIFSPCYVNADLYSFSINFYCPNYLWSCDDLDFCTNYNFHSNLEVVNIYKSFENIGVGIPPSNKLLGVLPKTR